MTKSKKIVQAVLIAVIALVLIAGNVVAGIMAPIISGFFADEGVDFNSQEVQNQLNLSDELCREIAGDSIVLLKNDGALPLEATNVNVFGYGATDKGFLLSGVGSGSTNISKTKRVTLLQGLKDAGLEYNTDIIKIYDDWSAANSSKVRPASGIGEGSVYRLAEPQLSLFDSAWESAQEFSDTAIFVLSRDGGENVGEIPKTQSGNADKTYLDISDAEQAMLDTLTTKFDKVIVLLNTTNTMHTGFIEDDGVSAALYVGIMGQSGAASIGKILTGDINPSGKMTDIMVYTPDYDPTFANNDVSKSSQGTNKNITYQEDIYYGYKWYETADAEGYFDDVDNEYGQGYDGVVQYPFGYGLSYTTFGYSGVEFSMPNLSELTAESKITVSLYVTNTGTVAGKDVIELYFTPTYYAEGIEKAEVNLLGFAKTATLGPGESQKVSITADAYYMAAYDCYDKNENGFMGYELERGNYTLKLMSDSHNMIPTTDASPAQVIYKVSGADICYQADPITKEPVENRFTGTSAYAGVPTDGSTAYNNLTYMTRANFEKTFPKTTVRTPHVSTEVSKANRYVYDGYDAEATMPATNQDNKLYLYTTTKGEKASTDALKYYRSIEMNVELYNDLADYESETWEQFLSQLSASEMVGLVHFGGFGTNAYASIGKTFYWDADGPAGFNVNSKKGDWSGDVKDEGWTAFPSEALMGCSWNEELMFKMGLSMGAEANVSAINGWYAPGVNLHRSAYTARNYEYYSEDGFLSGKLSAKVINGAKVNGLTCYLKHFACAEEGPNSQSVNTWITEQNLRENYLRPFEISVKDGGANGMMTAFNRIGASWAGANHALLTDILRNEWGFRGCVITDWCTGGAIGAMNPVQGVRAGNDLWLNPQAAITGGLSTSNKVDMYCAMKAAKNIIYAHVDSQVYALNYDDDSLKTMFNVQIGQLHEKEAQFNWWIILLVAFDAAVLAGLVIWGLKIFVKKAKA